MPDHNAVSMQINDHAGFVTFGLRGVVHGADLLEATRQIYAMLDEPWRYNRLYDLRALINMFQPEDFVAIVEQWRALSAPQVARRAAVLTEDPIRIARLNLFAPLFPDVELGLFDTLGAAIEWLTEGLTADHAAA